MNKKLKQMIAAATAALCLFSGTVYAYNFPTPDWGQLLDEKKKMVNAADFELYAEGSIESAPFYGARLEPRAGAYLGTIAEESQPFRPLSAYLTYIDDMRQNDIYYPANEIIKESNAVTMVGWTIDSMDGVDYDRVRRVLDTLDKYNKPMMIRFANEMNVSPLGDEPDKYVQVFRTVADIIHEYPNFSVVWAPNDLGALDRPFEYFYPGDEYVDWVGVSCYSIRYFLGNPNTDYNDTVYFMTGDYAWATNRVKPIIDFMQRNNIQKPVMISEGGVTTNSNHGEDYTSWNIPRMRNMMYSLIMKYPQIKMINYFNAYMPYEVERFNISDYQYAADIFNEAKNSGAYISEAFGVPEFSFQPAQYAGTLTAKDNIVNLYTLAYFAGYPDITVTYSLDGQWYSSSTQIPYKCGVDVSALADGAHTIEISSSTGERKSYTFHKSGTSIDFGGQPAPQAPQAAQAPQDAANEISVILNGNPLTFDQPPIIEDGRTLVPMRAIFEALGLSVDWDASTSTASAKGNGTTIRIQTGSNVMFVDNRSVALDVPAKIINGRTLVPLRAISEAYGCSVDWNGDIRQITINK
ncbi:MAG: hypothetical protein J1F64_00990 [Oscillospiraceae bacterium]|nr:hypothetical protein [Oscillospiraceae bacterium]